ncbi:MAG: AI-2E family transporter [Chloroflexota bacterium]|nr:MAG: AI-2E family transporter [Chloroflexota bacterium]
MGQNIWLRALLAIVLVIAGLHLAGLIWEIGTYLGDILLLFFLSWLLAFVLNPAARMLDDRCGLSRLQAALAVYVALLLAIISAGLILVPPAVSQLSRLGTSIPDYTVSLQELVTRLQSVLEGNGIPLDITAVYQPQVLGQRAEAIGTALAQNAIGIAQSIGTFFFGAIIILILSFYIMVDGERLVQELLGWFPARYREEVEFFLESVGRTFGGFMRGLLVQVVFYGVGTALIMWAAGLSFVLVVSIFAGAMMIIPLFGPFLAIIPPVIIAIFADNFTKAIIVFVALLILQQIVVNVVAPKVMSDALGIHPLLVFFGLLVGARVAGIWGAIFGVPAAGVTYAMLRFFRERAYAGKYSRTGGQVVDTPPAV